MALTAQQPLWTPGATSTFELHLTVRTNASSHRLQSPPLAAAAAAPQPPPPAPIYFCLLAAARNPLLRQVHVPSERIYYAPGALETLKLGWIHYLALFFPIRWILRTAAHATRRPAG